MKLDLITTQDLEQFKLELFAEMRNILAGTGTGDFGETGSSSLLVKVY